MSAIDSELNLLKQRMAVLEEQKRIEAEKAEKKANPIKVLGEILDEKKKLRNVLDDAPRHGPSLRPSKTIPMGTEEFDWLCDQNDKAKYLEPIFNMLKSINERLDVLENKKKENSIENLF
jgi:hypothetical protein